MGREGGMALALSMLLAVALPALLLLLSGGAHSASISGTRA